MTKKDTKWVYDKDTFTWVYYERVSASMFDDVAIATKMTADDNTSYYAIVIRNTAERLPAERRLYRTLKEAKQMIVAVLALETTDG
jgi:hypothetical protein